MDVDQMELAYTIIVLAIVLWMLIPEEKDGDKKA